MIDQAIGIWNVHFFDNKLLGDQANFLKILIISSYPYGASLRGTSATLPRCNELLQLGAYDINFQLAQGCGEPCIARILFHTVSGRDDAFRKADRGSDNAFFRIYQIS